MQRTVEITKIRFPTGREEEIAGKDYAALSKLKKAISVGAVVTERRKDFYKCTDEEFIKFAHYKMTVEREEIK